MPENPSASPLPLPPFVEPLFVPKLLLTSDQWIGWRAVWDPVRQKWDKRPACAADGLGNGFLDPRRGASYKEAIAATRRWHLAGIGFVLHDENVVIDTGPNAKWVNGVLESGPCWGLVGIDLDNCRDLGSGVLESWAQAILDENETYAEMSPSGAGIRMFALGKLSGGKTMMKSSAAQIELYTGGRYLTFTGRHLSGTPWDVKPAPRTITRLEARINAMSAGTADLMTGTDAGQGVGTTRIAGKTSSPPPGSAAAFDQYAREQSPFHKLNDLALRNYDAWVPELHPTARKASDGWRVASADLGRPDLEEDLSYHSTGIKWFGIGDMREDIDAEGRDREGGRTPVGAVMEWLKPGQKTTALEAAEWLCAKLKLEPGDLGFVAIGAGTAKLNGLEESQGLTAPAVFAPTLDLEAMVLATGDEYEKRETIVPGFERSEVTIIAGPSGAMKSAYALQLGVAIAANQGAVIGESQLDYPGAVLIYANEDAPKEVKKRYGAIRKRYRLAGGSLTGKINVRTSRLLQRNAQGDTVVLDKAEVAELRRLKRLNADLTMVVIDTLAAALLSDESNRDFQMTMDALKTLASELTIAIVVIHHYRKGTAGDDDAGPNIDRIRGGSSLTRSARYILYIEPPTKSEAARFGLGDERARRQYMKLSDGKTSYSDLTEDRWFKRETENLVVVDKRDGSKSLEKVLVLVKEDVAGAAHQVAAWQGWLDKLIGAVGMGGQVRVMQRGTTQPDSVQKILGMGTAQQAQEAIDTLCKAKVVVLRENWAKGNKVTSYQIVLSEIPNENNDVEEE